MLNIQNLHKLNRTQLQFFGHNCYLIENNETFLLIDPWLTNKGAFFGSWFQYPKNHYLRDELIAITNKKPGFVYFSHEHQDHFDLETLNLLNKKTSVIIPEYKDRFLYETIKKNGFACVEISENTDMPIGIDISLKVFISEIGINRDSAILITTNSFTFFNQNDCKIFDRIDEIKEKITYYTVQFSGATGHPVCYTNYSDEEKAEISHRKNNSKILNIVKAIKKLKPDFYIPAAGPAIFPYLNPQLSYGQDNIFIHQDKLNTILASNKITNILFPRPGDVVDNSIINKKFIPPPSSLELSAYKENIYDFWNSYNPIFSVMDLEKSINDRLDQIWDLDFECDILLQFKWGKSEDEQLVIDLENKKILYNYDLPETQVYILEAEKKYFSLMSSGNRWQDIYLSLRANLYRNPDEFNNYINIFLFSDPENIRDSFISSLTIPTERILKKNKIGICYEINRYCPHQGADLLNVEINDKNEIVCPRHGWQFSLDNNGQSINSAESICAKILKLSQ
jgi:UDP-MurNAc hydroxylase